jgi:MFS family permease
MSSEAAGADSEALSSDALAADTLVVEAFAADSFVSDANVSESRPTRSGSGGSFFADLTARIPDPNVWRIYTTTFALGMAYGLAISVIAVFLDAHGFGKATIGSLAAWFAAGIVALSLPMGGLIRRFSAKTMLCVSLTGYALAVSVFPFLHSFPAIAAVRFFDGACSVGVWVSSESILLSRADRDNKAFMTSLYAIALAFGYVVGPLLARVCTAFLPLEVAFVVAGAIAAGAALFAKLRLDPDKQPEPESSEPGAARAKHKTLLGLLVRIKSSCFATFAYGYFQASVVLFLPLYLMESKGVTQAQTIVIPAFFAAGMLLFSNFAGRLADHYGHLFLMRWLGLLGMFMILGFVWLDSYTLMCLAVFVAGASLASISPVSLALQGVVAGPHEYGRSTSIYNAFYALGILLGPPLSSFLFASRGGGAMLLHLAAIWAVFIVFTLVFRNDDPAAVRRALREA